MYYQSIGSDVMGKPDQVVSLEYRVNKSFEGKYFMGHTPVLPLNGNKNAWGGLYNPKGSKVNLFVNTFTVSNYSSTPFTAELWLNSKLIEKGKPSPFLSPANTAKTPLPKSEVSILYNQGVTGNPVTGASIFSRIAEANSTTVGNYYGKIIIPPEGSFIVFLHAPGSESINAEVAFGYWVDKT